MGPCPSPQRERIWLSWIALELVSALCKAHLGCRASLSLSFTFLFSHFPPAEFLTSLAKSIKAFHKLPIPPRTTTPPHR